MKQTLKDFYNSLTDEELEYIYDLILERESELAFNHYFAREEKIHRQYVKEKNVKEGAK